MFEKTPNENKQKNLSIKQLDLYQMQLTRQASIYKTLQFIINFFKNNSLSNSLSIGTEKKKYY